MVAQLLSETVFKTSFLKIEKNSTGNDVPKVYESTIAMALNANINENITICIERPSLGICPDPQNLPSFFFCKDTSVENNEHCLNN